MIKYFLIIIFGCGFAFNAYAASACTFSMPTSGINFGNYISGGGVSASGGNVDGEATFNINCTKTGLTVSFPVSMFIDSGGESDIGLRKLIKPATASAINYNLYTDVARTIIWSNNGTPRVGVPLAGFFLSTCATTTCNYAVKVYGRIPEGQAGAPGQYEDTLVVTVTF